MTNTDDNLLRRSARVAFALVAFVWMVLEEWLWESLVKVTAVIARLPILRRLETWVRRLPPWAAMVAFILPVLILLPVKVMAFWFLATGHVRSGVLVFIGGKVLGTALLARLFTLTKPALLQVAWFCRCFAWFTSVRDRVYLYVKSLRAMQVAKAWLMRARERLRRVWRALRFRRAA
ncbi:MAG: hypothetical protein NT107_11935 [Planctomycetota bacterium]|jgi:hypothetical protein|nr:hypothetical protein [Planctomycetota bacterium]MSR38657.1 hypothetical protein [Planctomycetota bacterium]